jgi:hypothetical protein
MIHQIVSVLRFSVVGLTLSRASLAPTGFVELEGDASSVGARLAREEVMSNNRDMYLFMETQ